MMSAASVPPPDADAPVPMARPVVVPGLARSVARPLNPLELPTLPQSPAWRDASVVVLTLLGTLFAVPMFVAAILTLLAGGNPPEDLQIIAIGKWFEAAIAVAILIALLRRRRLPAASFGLQTGLRRQLVWAGAAVVGAYAYMFSTALLIVVALSLIPGLEQDVAQRAEFAQQLPLSSVLRSVLLLIPVAVHEEVLFRGLLLPYLRRLLGRWWLAVVLASLLFGVLHVDQGVIGALQIVGLGAVFAVFFLLSRSLVAVTLAHFLFDLMQFQLMRVLLPVFGNPAPAG